MNRAITAASAFLICATAFAAGEASAQARGPSVMEKRSNATESPDFARARKLGELDTWLRRLVGRYVVTRSGITQGRADCIIIGDGPGVHCVNGGAEAAQSATLFSSGGPWMILFGLDPDAPGIRYLRVDGQSLAEGDLGKLSGDTVTFSRVQCPTSIQIPFRPQPRFGIPPTINILACYRHVRIYAPAGDEGSLIQTKTELEVSVDNHVHSVELTENIRLQPAR